MAGAVGEVSTRAQDQPWVGEGVERRRGAVKDGGVERRKDGGEKGEGKQCISGWLHTLPGAGDSSLLAGLRPALHFQLGLFESINLPPVWAPIKEAALQSLHSAVASCRLSFLFTTDFVCLSPLPPILGTLWTETQYPPSPEQGLAPDLEFQEISRVVSG